MIKKALFYAMLCTSCFRVLGETGSVVETIQYIRVAEPGHTSSTGDWSPPTFWFTLNNVTSAGGCKKWNGRVLFVAEDQYFLSILLATQFANKQISVSYDDTLTKNTYCRAKFITTGEPPPS